MTMCIYPPSIFSPSLAFVTTLGITRFNKLQSSPC